MPIVIAGSIRVPAAYRAHLLEASQPYQVASRVEVGSEHYIWSLDSADDEMIYVFEQWQDEASLAAHFAAEPYLATLQLFAETCEFEADVNKYRVDLVEPVYDTEGVPRADFFSDSP